LYYIILYYIILYYIIKTIETKIKKNYINIYFKLEKKLNYFSNVKFIATSFESHSLFFDAHVDILNISFIQMIRITWIE